MNWKGYNFSRNREVVINSQVYFLKISPQPKQKYLADKENEFHVFQGYTKGI